MDLGFRVQGLGLEKQNLWSRDNEGTDVVGVIEALCNRYVLVRRACNQASHSRLGFRV